MSTHLFDRLIELVLHLKLGTAAAVLIVGLSGVLITATVVGDEVRIQVFAPAAAHQTSESIACDEALAARSEALRRLDNEVAKARADLRVIRDLAEALAERTNKDLSDDTLDAAERDVRSQLDDVRTRARDEIRLAADLAPCEDNNPETGVVLDVADLRQRYGVIVDRAITDLQTVLVNAGELFDRLVREARMKRAEAGSASSGSGSGSGSGD
ncbi:MAG TPA: hypothetical protein VMQ78_02510 [Candidatus Limnocylindria bacterium]|nr:hypothetical protein [Candidatus Limnocylindria bacterium]